ncbi:HepT-like ribonuclease domain-containing protein [Lichenicoccus sp.]|uniref:HepT-like ribonuclease domain-containing protein n=1 Tax=Lichenicoccus sp. TaxID=2781899 RepID=UPI003D097E6C
MTRRGSRERLEDIRDAAMDALDFCAGLDEAAFTTMPVADRRTYRALKNVLSEVGEAVKLLPPELLARHPEVDWRGWAGLRDVISHQYFNLELPRLRPTIIDELPLLLHAVVRELSR